jgi:hypothetical protein
MAIAPKDEFPGQTIASDPDYPHGKARNVLVSGDGTGTPWEERITNDIFGFQQALLEAANITPSGDPDTANASQYLEALAIIRAAHLASGFTAGGTIAGSPAFSGWPTFVTATITRSRLGVQLVDASGEIDLGLGNIVIPWVTVASRTYTLPSTGVAPGDWVLFPNLSLENHTLAGHTVNVNQTVLIVRGLNNDWLKCLHVSLP